VVGISREFEGCFRAIPYSHRFLCNISFLMPSYSFHNPLALHGGNYFFYSNILFFFLYVVALNNKFENGTHMRCIIKKGLAHQDFCAAIVKRYSTSWHISIYSACMDNLITMRKAYVLFEFCAIYLAKQ